MNKGTAIVALAVCGFIGAWAITFMPPTFQLIGAGIIIALLLTANRVMQ